MATYAIYLCLVVLHQLERSNANLTETDLQRKLFKDYRKDAMPNLNRSKPMEISIQLFINTVYQVDAKEQTITIRGFLELRWRDEFLVWNENMYSNISEITVRDDSIWRPHISLLDAFGTPSDLGYGGQAVISSGGRIVVWPYKLFTVSCEIAISYFPFDSQSCNFDLASWTSNSSVISLVKVNDTVNISKLKASGEWDVTNTSVNQKSIPFGNEEYDHVIFTINLKRKPLFHVMNLMIPVLCISLLNVISFLLPAEDGERITLSISVFLTLAVFLTIVNDSMPEASDNVAIFSVYVGLQLFGSVMTMVFTVVALFIFHMETERDVPKVLFYFVKLLCMGKNASQTEELVSERRMNAMTSGSSCKNEVYGDRVTEMNECNKVSWKMVSRAFDKLCALIAILWHVLLFIIMIISIKQ
ncbi:Neuronal acetylcholine receptor subunit beta-4 [Mactra antiquata]